MQNGWYSAVEDLCLQSLNGQMNIDDLSSQINSVDLSADTSYAPIEEPDGQATAMQINMEYQEQMPVSVYPFLLNSLLQKDFASYSVWSTSGSERIEPCLFITQSLPLSVVCQR